MIATFKLPYAASIEKKFGRTELRQLDNPPLLEPTQLACYSQTADGSIFWDERCLGRFWAGISSESGADLNEGYQSFVEKREDEAILAYSYANVLACLRARAISLEDVHFVTFPNNLTKILGMAYNRREPWEMGVYKRSGTVYLNVRRLPEVQPTEKQQRHFYWGHAFEKWATENQNGGPSPSQESASQNASVQGSALENRAIDARIDANEEFRAVFRTELGPHTIIMAAVIDCYEETKDKKKVYVELKTNYRKVGGQTVKNFDEVKLLKIWVQSFVTGVKRIACGLRDESGKLIETKMMSTKDIMKRALIKNPIKKLWEGGVCLAFAVKVLSWIYNTAMEGENYLLRFVPEKNHLELLQADACPGSITKHVGELSGDPAVDL